MRSSILKFARRCAALLLAAFVLASGAWAEQIVLPASLSAIEDNAFSGDTAIRTVTVPSGATSIGSQAFSNCSKLGWVTIPASVSSIGSGAFSGCASDLLIQTSSGSAAANYARNNNIDYQAGTKYRALLIGQEYRNWDKEEWLSGPFEDVAAMSAGLKRFSGTSYSVTVLKDQTAQGIINAIKSAFSGATVNDVSLFYYSGHGWDASDTNNDGALIGIDNTAIPPSVLREALDKIPGRKIVLLDSCLSGNMISPNVKGAKSEVQSGSPEEFVNSFVSAFQGKTKGGLIGDSYFVIAAAAADQSSWSIPVGGSSKGLFTMCFLAGCGYSYGFTATGLPADANSNGVLTVNELFQYVSREAISYIDWLRTHYADLADMEYQYTQVYPSNCNWFGMLRS